MNPLSSGGPEVTPSLVADILPRGWLQLVHTNVKMVQKMGLRGERFRSGFAARLVPQANRGPLQIENGNGEMELRALADFALHPDAAAVALDKILDEREPESGAANFAGTSHIDAVKTFKNARLIHLRNADAGIGN